MNPDETPAKGVAVVVNPGRVPGVTAANGVAKLTINTELRIQELTITVSLQNVFFFPLFSLKHVWKWKLRPQLINIFDVTIVKSSRAITQL